jgi:hypothetical protein
MKANTVITTKEMCRQNIIAVKVEDSTRVYNSTLGGTVTKPIRRTKYLKVCWMCGSTYESHKSSSYACSQRCSNNLAYALNNDYAPPANMEELTKAKNVRDVVKEWIGD